MVVTASTQLGVDVCRWKTWGDTREMANERGGITVSRQMKTAYQDRWEAWRMDIEKHVYKSTRACISTDCFYKTKSCTHANITNITSASLPQQWETASSVVLTVWGLLRRVVREQKRISTCLWCTDLVPLRDWSNKPNKSLIRNIRRLWDYSYIYSKYIYQTNKCRTCSSHWQCHTGDLWKAAH